MSRVRVSRLASPDHRHSPPLRSPCRLGIDRREGCSADDDVGGQFVDRVRDGCGVAEIERGTVGRGDGDVSEAWVVREVGERSTDLAAATGDQDRGHARPSRLPA